jgi:hypothetical protein
MSTGLGKAAACVVASAIVLLASDVARSQPAATAHAQGEGADGTLTRVVREATSQLQDVRAAVSAGYALSGGCVTGPEEGAMGVHYVNAELAGDGQLDASRPEALVFAPQGGQLQLAAVEYIVLAEQWNAANSHPPVLHGQHFHYVSAPNRAGLPAYYELHVWAWKRNAHGTFTDWNPDVRCDTYSPPSTSGSPQ